jgi:cytochrome P450
MMQNRTFFKFPLWVPTHRHRRFFKVKKELYRLIQNIISEKSTDPDDSVLSDMIWARDSEGRKMQEHELHDELITLFVTGFETTGNALSWIFIRLAQHPNYQEKLYSEIQDLKVKEDASLKDLMSSTWLKAVINETLRLHPPVWGYPRRCLNGDSIGGQAIPEKAHVHLSIFMAQRHPEYWHNPDEYKPERFVERADHPAFFPFGIGSRMCIGEHLAYLEMYSLVYFLISKFKVELTLHEPVEMLSLITLHPKGDVYLKFSPRNGG